uniref:uncharacterized protein LOC122600252 isoform X2 n=1 Tax=Erigeron canadensis TaxID=72917 RepID=UPI001CB89755|nr:uncharacterized protein LOC122600252 isoform X2 [Erigeron canadensis]
MASSGKFDLSSTSPSRPLYTPGKRGSHTASAMDRSSSFRVNIENPILSSLPNMSRSTINVSQGEVTKFFQCLRFDLKSMAAEYKCNQHGNFRRLANAALCAPDGSPSGSLKGKLPSSHEDMKRLRIGLRESTIKSRERVKIFSEVLSVINKCFPSISSRKRSRPDTFSGNRSTALLADRVGITVGKIGAQNRALTSGFDFEQPKVEERCKPIVPNKRTKTSMVDQRGDARPNTPVRSYGSADRDREVLSLQNSNTNAGVDLSSPIADGWEKTKMKKRRTGIKAETAPSTSSASTKLTDGSRSCLMDAKPRPVVANGGIVAGKSDSVGMRSSIPRPEQLEITSVLHDKRNQTSNVEQERTNVRPLKKVFVRDEFITGTSSSSTKLHAAARGPRSGTGVVPKLTNVQRATVSSDLDSSYGAIKNANLKQTLSTRSSSPPVARWADRRFQKISRTARRTNLVPVVSTIDEVPDFGNNDITVSGKGSGNARRFPANSPKKSKSKGDHTQSSTLSESEESGAAEIRYRDNGCRSEKVVKISTSVLPTKKNKFKRKEDLSTGVGRQGKFERGFASARSVGKVRTAKQLRTGRVGFDKPESKIGRASTGKLSGPKAFMRQEHSAAPSALHFAAASDDEHGELLAAVNAVINPGCAWSSPFWRLMDPLFGYVSDVHVNYIKQEGIILSTADTTNLLDSCTTHPIGTVVVGAPNNGRVSNSKCSELLISESSLCQRLLAALISEDDGNEYTWCANDDLHYNVYGSVSERETDIESNGIKWHLIENFETGRSFSRSYSIDSTLRSCNEVVHSRSNNNIMSMSNPEIATSGLLSDPAMITSCQYGYANVSINERLLLEIHSLGLYPAPVPDLVHPGDEDISKDISRLQGKHYLQVSRKKSLLDKLLKSTEQARELYEKEYEQLSLEKLTGMAYQKYMSCWGPSAPGGKSAFGKMAKKAALSCVQRTLDRCHKFEETGKSCFAEPLFKEMFISGLSHLNDTQVNGVIDEISMDSISGTPLSPSPNHGINPSEQTLSKDDVWSIRVKKKELYLDDVAVCTSSGIINNAKGKRSERDGLRNGGPKSGRPASSNVKGKRKTKTKLKQRTTQLSASVNDALGKFSDQQRAPLSSALKSTVGERDACMWMENCDEPLDLSHLQLPGMDDFVVGDDFGGQGEDIGSWLNIDDDVLQQDDDFMGLEIPMDDLTDLNMMV